MDAQQENSQMKMRDYIAMEDRRLIRESMKREIRDLKDENERLRRELAEAVRALTNRK